jgi:hypothetical protein
MEYYQKKSVSLDTDGGVKVLSEKTGSDENYSNSGLDSVGSCKHLEFAG